MTESLPNPQSSRFALFCYGFRPFFLLAGWLAIIAIGAWMWLHTSGAVWLGKLPLSLWHAHEMLFGFIVAAIAGFMLTAVPSWTSSRGFGGLPLVLLTGLWVMGRLAFALAAILPFPLLAVIELAFLPGVAVLLAPPLWRSRNRNTVLLLVLLALWVADAVFLYASQRTDPALANAAIRTGLNLVLLLITVIGGRIVPAFTANGLRSRGIEVSVRNRPLLEKAVIGLMIAMLVFDAVFPHPVWTGVIAAAAGMAHVARLAGWNGLKTFREPLIWVLHLAYAWLPAGLLLKAAFLLGGFGWAAFWLHALGAGAAASMILAVMTRASLGHTGRPLSAIPGMAWSYGLLSLAAAVRVFGPFLLPFAYVTTIRLAGALWLFSFGIYVVQYTPILVRPRVDGKPG